MVKVLVFDTETTDKPPIMTGGTWDEKQKNEKKLLNSKYIDETWSQMINKWPSIIQLSYILYDTDESTNALITNKYIDIPDNIVISEQSIAIHHITRESIRNAPSENVANIQEALSDFFKYVKEADIIVAHNVQFDRKMIIAELLRLSKEKNLSEIMDMMDDSKFECTMEKTMSICKLQQKIEYKDKITGEPKMFYKIKNPKLSEAYAHFFGYAPSGDALHDALIDVVVCLRVYLKYNNLPDVCGKNDIITNYIMEISPPGYTCPEPEDSEVLMVGGKRRKNKHTKKRKPKKTKKSKKSKKHRKNKTTLG